MLDHPNNENYLDPRLYDLESGPFKLDGTILFELARRAGGPLLEVGCGTGRVTIPLAQRGFEMTGLDAAPEMLHRARQKADGLPVHWICADVRRFRIQSRYRFIFTVGAPFQHLLSRPDQEAMLARVREHLTPDGKLLIDASLPRPARMVDALEEEEWFSYVDDNGRDITVSGTDQYDHIRGIWHQTYFRRWLADSGQPVTRRVRLALRYFMPQEMEALLHYNGFKILDRFGDWVGAPLSESSGHQIYLCELA